MTARTAQGVEPIAGLLQASDGNFYGVTSGGGDFNLGTAFRLSVPLAPIIQTVRKTAGQVNLTWTAVAGQTYQLQCNSNLGSVWSNIGNAALATNGTMAGFDSAPADPRRFYRVVLLQ
ncbi:MAG TPA: choice-of-anchor tandem repeat GloVer-containing protein [Candidatus Binatia bacterium]|nr:choice-of-anchor tandem repeat GloVer-containing protein [Candidatus Binatia bacterium]